MPKGGLPICWQDALVLADFMVPCLRVGQSHPHNASTTRSASMLLKSPHWPVSSSIENAPRKTVPPSRGALEAK